MIPENHLPDELLDGWLDDRLSTDECRRVDDHLAVCERCRRQLAVLRATVEAVRELPPAPMPEGLAARLGVLLDAEEGRGEAGATELAPPVAHPRAARRPLLARVRWAAAAAAVVAFVAIAQWLGPLGAPDADPDSDRSSASPPASDLVGDFATAFSELERGGLPAALETAAAAEVEDRWQRAELGFQSRVFELDAMDIHLAGGGVAIVGGHPAAVTAYRGATGDLLLCWMFNAAVSELPEAAERRQQDGFEFHLYRRGDLTLVFWQEGDVLCALAGHGDPEAVLGLAVAKAMAPAAGRDA